MGYPWQNNKGDARIQRWWWICLWQSKPLRLGKNDNFGVSYIGCLLVDYNIENVRFDVFHGASNVTKSLLRYLWRLMEGNSDQVKYFSQLLGTLRGWGLYEIDPWIAGNFLCHLKCRYTKDFLDKYELVIQKPNAIFVESDIFEFVISFWPFY